MGTRPRAVVNALQDGSGDVSGKETHMTGCRGLADGWGEANSVSGRKADGVCVWHLMGPVRVSGQGGSEGVVCPL